MTVIARWRPGLHAEEQHPGGYRILRVPFSAIDGLPVPRLVRSGRAGLRHLHAWRTRTPYRPPADPMAVMRAAGSSAAAGSGKSTAAASDAGTGGFDRSAAAPPSGAGARKASLPRRAASSLVRRLSIFLTIRSQGRFAAQVAPPADLYHGMAYMGVPIALRLARRDRAKVVYDARDIYLDAANLARMRGPMRWFIARSERGWARAADRVITVNKPYAEVMADRFGVPEPLIILNCSYRFTPPDPRPRLFHEALGLDPSAAVVLYQGGFSPDRGIEQLLEAIRDVPGGAGADGVRQPRRELRAEEAEGRRPRPGATRRPAHGAARLGRLRRRRRDAHPAVDAQPPPDDAQQAVRGDGRRGSRSSPRTCPGWPRTSWRRSCGVLCDPTDPAALAAAIRSLLDAPADERARLGANALTRRPRPVQLGDAGRPPVRGVRAADRQPW